MHARPRAICLIAKGPDDLAPPHGPVAALACQFREAGWHAHVLYAGSRRPKLLAAAARHFRAVGVTLSTLDNASVPASFQVRNVFGASSADHSDRVRHALEQLCQQQPFGVLDFPAGGGLGFRALQAKRAGLAFENVCVVVRLDTCSPWQREQDHRWPADLEELAIDFAERYAFEQADVQVSPCPTLLDYTRGMGWEARADRLLTPGGTAGLVQAYEGLLAKPAAPPVVADAPLVSAAIPYYNMGPYLPDTLASLAAQTYPNVEVLVIDDESTSPLSIRVLEEMQARYPRYRFLRQANAGPSAARNVGLREATGDYFLPVDADNIARPDMIERFVAGMQRNPDVSALSCYFLAFNAGDPLTQGNYLYAYRPTGGPHTMACTRNVYGDGNALFRTASLRAVGGFELDRGTSFEDWEVFVKMVNAGQRIAVLPEHLFYYRHRETSYSRVTDGYRNHQRVLRQFLHLERLPPAERAVLWMALHGFQRQLEALTAHQRSRRYRLVDGVYNLCGKLPFVKRLLR